MNSIEWPKLIELAEKLALTELGKDRVRLLEDSRYWAGTLESARRRQQETQEVMPTLLNDAFWGPLSELPSAKACFERLSKRAVLDLAELAILKRWIKASENWREFSQHFPKEKPQGELLAAALASLPTFSRELRELERILTPEGELSENASPRLFQLFQETRSLKREIGILLDSLLKSFSQKGVLQEAFTDVRDGRYVLPIKISSQSEVDGIIYESSVSRQTVFVEPKEVAGLNNRLKQKQNEIQQEVFNILQEVSTILHPRSEAAEAAIQTLSYWDSVQARARLGTRYQGKEIQVTHERDFSLNLTTHPILYWSLKPEEIVKNDIHIQPPVQTLLLTGPNTGGKTVLLKTLGLAGICARTGFTFPASDSPCVPFFDRICADLGDPQSIENHLSSFSGHIARFKDILSTITPQSLVLIDELNSATDPEEGAALGRAFLEMVMRKGALVVTTTHDPQLKAIAISDQRILCAGMEFDEIRRAPTYKIILGTPGRSRAIETAERLGIPTEMLDLARSYLSQQHIAFETLLSGLQKDSSDAVKLKAEAARIHEEALRLQEEWTQKSTKGINELLERTKVQLKRSLEQAQQEVRKKALQLEEAKTRKELEATRKAIFETFESAEKTLDSSVGKSAIASETPKAKPASSPLAPGDRVRVPKWKSTGTLLEIKGSRVKVALGSIQMNLDLSEIEFVSKSSPIQSSSSKATPTVQLAPPSSIDLRGWRFDEAMAELSQYLDQAYRSRAWAQVTVVHGLGTGSLREGTRKLLGELPYIKEFRDAGVGMGGTGATLIEFDLD